MTLFLCGEVMLGRGIDQILPYLAIRTCRNRTCTTPTIRRADCGARPDPRPADVAWPLALCVLVLDPNHRAKVRLRCPNRMVAITGAGRMFDETGTLEAAADLARDWFCTYLRTTHTGEPTV